MAKEKTGSVDITYAVKLDTDEFFMGVDRISKPKRVKSNKRVKKEVVENVRILDVEQE